MDVIGSIVIPLCIILPKMSGWIKCFENGGKNMLFKIYIKCNSIWNKIKELLSVKYYSEPIHDDSYIKSKFTTFIDVI